MMRRLVAQTRVELLLTLRRGESLLLTFAIPVLLLGFFSKVDVLPTPSAGRPVDFLFPGVLALAIMSTAMVSLAIATSFERQTGVLKRLGSTPLTRSELLGAKTLAMIAVEVLQVVILVIEGLILGFRFSGSHVGTALAGAVLGTVAFAGLGLLMAGALPALTTLAAANGLYLVLLLLGGMVIPLAKLPSGLRATARGLPAGALSDVFHEAIRGASVPGRAWLVLGGWALLAPALAAARFRWE